MCRPSRGGVLAGCVLIALSTLGDDAAGPSTNSGTELGYWTAKHEMTEGSHGLVILMGSSVAPSKLAALPSVAGSTAEVNKAYGGALERVINTHSKAADEHAEGAADHRGGKDYSTHASQGPMTAFLG